MVTEREADDSKRLLDRISEEYETEYRGGRLRLARRNRNRRGLISWPSLGAVVIWIVLIVAVAGLAVILDMVDLPDPLR